MLNKGQAVHHNGGLSINWALGGVLLCLWVGLTFQGLVSAVKIWYISEIFNHCFFVLPVSLYLIWEKKDDINWRARQCTLLALPFIFLQVLLYVIGIAGDIQLFQHAAMFSLLPTLTWFYLGNRISKKLIFPLSFMLFAIPFGEELIPFLQEITADISVEMVSWAGVPLYRSGLFLEIPQGRFLVAEACSGISFLIASIVLGNLFAYMNLKRMTTRVGFVLLSVIFPILANAVRVFGIIMIGYASDMKHAVGADHLIYGWFFFAFVIICLLGIGEIIRRVEKRYLLKQNAAGGNIIADETIGNADAETSIAHIEELKTIGLKSLVVAVVLVLGITKSISINLAGNVAPIQLEFQLPFSAIKQGNALSTWQPEFKRSTRSEFLTIQYENSHFVYFTAYYDGTDGELISTQNDIFAETRWSLSDKRTESLADNLRINNMTLKNGSGQQLTIYHLYIINGAVFTDTKKAKLYQVWLKLQGKPYDGIFLAISGSGEVGDDSIKQVLAQAIHALQAGFEARDAN
ncbi:exosortase A [Glaciecola sp. 33A]|uniref:exosortase A n=1 Tax=Glaciecola sp. 33A TaxID=2057807 RepID=UPI0018E294F3|nr:exosortase A [Glaciecola sp. 33A]